MEMRVVDALDSTPWYSHVHGYVSRCNIRCFCYHICKPDVLREKIYMIGFIIPVK